MGGGKGDTGKSTQVSKVELPPWVDKAAQSNYAKAENIASRPYEAYQGEDVANLTGYFDAAAGYLPGLDDYLGNYGQATNIYGDLGNYQSQTINPSEVRAGLMANTDLSPYMNPYINNVVDRTQQNMLRAGEQQQNKLSSDAGQAAAFGGSRHAMQGAIQGAETNRAIGDKVAELMSAGYDKATATALADLDRQLKADTQSGEWAQQAQSETEKFRQGAAGIRKGGAEGLEGAEKNRREALGDISSKYLGFNTIQQGQNQKELDAERARWDEQQNWDLQNLNILMAALGMSPYGKTETSTKTESKQGGSDFGSLLGGFAQLAPLFMSSDKTEKTDIKKLGKDEATGLPMYAYRYKGDPKTYPKVVGPMAQDVQKKYPKAVKVIAGKKAIDLTKLVA